MKSIQTDDSAQVKLVRKYGGVWRGEPTSGTYETDMLTAKVWRGLTDSDWHFSIKWLLGLESFGEAYNLDSAIECVSERIAGEHFRALVASVANKLGSGWNIEAREEDGSFRSSCLLGPDWAKLWFRLDKDQIHISSSHQSHEASKHLHSGDGKLPRISVSASKTAAQISADIERLVLPDLVRLLQTATDRAIEAARFADLTTVTALGLAKAIKGRVLPLGHDGNLLKRVVRGCLASLELSFEVVGSQVYFPEMSVTVKEAAAMMALLAKSRNTVLDRRPRAPRPKKTST